MNNGGGNVVNSNEHSSACPNPQNRLNRLFYDIIKVLQPIINRNSNQKYLIYSLDSKIKTLISSVEHSFYLCLVNKEINSIFIFPESAVKQKP